MTRPHPLVAALLTRLAIVLAGSGMLIAGYGVAGLRVAAHPVPAPVTQHMTLYPEP